MYKQFFVDTWPWWAGGISIGLFVFLLAYLTGQGLGVSTGYVNLCKLTLPVKKYKFFNTDDFKDIFNWRFFFVIGIILGGLGAGLAAGNYYADFRKGFEMMNQVFPGNTKYIALFIGGILVGFGARFAGGCTSGHSILGMAQLSPSSIISTICFLAAGFATANILYRLIGGVI